MSSLGGRRSSSPLVVSSIKKRVVIKELTPKKKKKVLCFLCMVLCAFCEHLSFGGMYCHVNYVKNSDKILLNKLLKFYIL
jgi:hypothetical protein